MLIYSKTKSSVFKIWDNADLEKTDSTGESARACDYEKNVYTSKIRPFLMSDRTLPFLPYISGSNHVTVGELYNIITGDVAIEIDDSILFFMKAFWFFLEKTSETHREYAKELYTTRTVGMNPTTFSDIKNRIISYIETPFMVGSPLHDLMNGSSTDIMIFYIKQIIRGINHMYRHGLVHNDLHSGNIFIQHTTTPRKVYIFDWDRGYIKGKINPILNQNKCVPYCSQSQCNIVTPNEYATDLYKFLYYVISQRSVGDINIILKECFGIVNRRDQPFHTRFIKNSLTSYGPFFKERNCTILQFPNENMKRVHSSFGPISFVASQTGESYREPVPAAVRGRVGNISESTWGFFQIIMILLVILVGTAILPTQTTFTFKNIYSINSINSTDSIVAYIKGYVGECK
jgi:serine/threonine protein kinase